MQAFLYKTAKDILDKYKQDIQSYCFVFPNKRTNFFFRKYYSELYGVSHKAPKMLEIRKLIISEDKITQSYLLMDLNNYETIEVSKSRFPVSLAISPIL